MSGTTPLFSNVHEEDEELLCGRCGQTWAKPVELRPCRHRQCLHCTAGTTHCATCHAAITQLILPRKLLVKFANNVIVKCNDCDSQMSRLDSYAHYCVPAPVVGAVTQQQQPVDLPLLPVKSMHSDPTAAREETLSWMSSSPTAATVAPAGARHGTFPTAAPDSPLDPLPPPSRRPQPASPSSLPPKPVPCDPDSPAPRCPLMVPGSASPYHGAPPSSSTPTRPSVQAPPRLNPPSLLMVAPQHQPVDPPSRVPPPKPVRCNPHSLASRGKIPFSMDLSPPQLRRLHQEPGSASLSTHDDAVQSPPLSSTPTRPTVQAPPRLNLPAALNLPSLQTPLLVPLPAAEPVAPDEPPLDPPPQLSNQGTPPPSLTTLVDRPPPQRVPEAATRGDGGAAGAGFPSAPGPTLGKFLQSNRSASEPSPDDVLALTERRGPGSYPQDSAKSTAKAADLWVSEVTLSHVIELVFCDAAKRAAIEAEAVAERDTLAVAARANRARIEDDRARIDRARIEENHAVSTWPRDVSQSAPRHLRIPRFDETPTIYEQLQPSAVCASTAFQTLGWYVYEFKGFPLGLSRVLLLDFLDAHGLTEASGLCCVWGDEWKRITLASTRQRLGKTYDRATDHGTWLLAFRQPLTALQLDPTAAGPVTSGSRPFAFERENSQTVWQLQAMGLQITPR